MCELLNGSIDLGCDGAGGARRYYWGDWNQLTSASGSVVEANGEVTTLTMPVGKKIYPINFEAEVSNFNEKSVGSKTNSSVAWESTATAVLAGNTKEQIVLFELATKTRVFLIAELEDGSYEILFLNRGGKVMVERNSGTSFEDLNGNTITITSRGTVHGRKIAYSVFSALIDA
jgi:hypothetical protein